jgi:hypothetical protein
MKRNRVLWSMLFSAGVLALSAQAAQARVEFEVNVAPPPDRVEVVPAPRAGYTWEKGYWNWDGGRYAWHDGRWVENREGHRYIEHRWEHDGDHYRLRTGHWDDED